MNPYRILKIPRTAGKVAIERAIAEVKALMTPPDTTVLHRTPEKVDGPETVYWSYYAPKGGHELTWSTEKAGDVQKAVFVVAPAPTAEYLPRLEVP